MASLAVILSQHVKEKGLHIEVEGLVVQEQLGQQTEVLAVKLQQHQTDITMEGTINM